ncbi:MAG: PAS domain S-box protein [Deltaproteobacteria bacterium]|nr:MAG: PAS domain S-box protein [Deltaproteobacteria bacterium]
MLNGYRQELLYKQIGEASSDAFICSDCDGVICLWNPGAEAIFGYASQEAVGQTLDLIMPEKLRLRHWEGYHKVMQAGVTRYEKDLLSTPALRKDGTSISIEFSMAMLRDGAGEMVGTAAIVRDVTERWMKEKGLKDQLKHLEAKVAELPRD